MDNIQKRFSCAKGWRIATPSFPDTPSMDSFYKDAHEALEARFTELREGGGRGIFVADYFIREQKGALEVTLRLRRRINGKYVDERSFSHRWHGGVIVPRRPHSPTQALIRLIIAKKSGVNKRKSETTK